MYRKFIIPVFLYTFFAIVFSGCNSNSCPDVMLGEQQLIQKYHDLYFPGNESQQANTGFSIYLDYSSGMKVAFADENTMQFYKLFINSLKISTVDFYEVDKNKVNKIENLDKSRLYRKIKESKRFSGVNAPLGKALDDIVKKQTEAVLITDGELWDKGERDDPWAREGFEIWLKAGNTIDFYVTDHTDAGKEKHLFYMFFIPKHKIHDKSSTVANFKYYLENSVEAKKLSHTHFSFSNSNYSLTQEYETKSTGGVNENADLDPETYINEGSNKHFEYHEYFLPWSDMMKYIYEAYDDEGNQMKGGAPLICKLFLETNGLEFYSIEELGINVYDIRSDFDKFRFIEEAKQNPPTYEIDESGKKILDEDNNPILCCPGQFGAYNEETGKLLIDTVFVSTKFNPLSELFLFDHEWFMNNYREEGRGEIIIKIHGNFNGSQISNETENLHRIDIYLKKVTPKTTNPNLEKFIWEGKQVAKNRSIYNSILGALNEANPRGKVIYSYYVKTQPDDYNP